jgi:hypothetical protein
MARVEIASKLELMLFETKSERVIRLNSQKSVS